VISVTSFLYSVERSSHFSASQHMTEMITFDRKLHAERIIKPQKRVFSTSGRYTRVVQPHLYRQICFTFMDTRKYYRSGSRKTLFEGMEISYTCSARKVTKLTKEWPNKYIAGNHNNKANFRNPEEKQIMIKAVKGAVFQSIFLFTCRNENQWSEKWATGKLVYRGQKMLSRISLKKPLHL